MNIAVLILLLVALTSCSSVKDDRQRFSKHDFNIGRNINVNEDSQFKIEPTNDPAVKKIHI